MTGTTRLRGSRQEAEAILGRADPAHERRAMRFAAPAAMAVREEERRRGHREAHRAAEAAALEVVHGEIRRTNATHMPNSSSVLAT